MKKSLGFVGTLVFFLIVAVMGALLSFSKALGFGWHVFIVGSALVFAIAMIGYLYGLLNQLLVNKAADNASIKKQEDNAALLALGAGLVLSVAAFFAGKYLGDIQFFTIDTITATIVSFLDYLSTGPVLAILLGIFFIPLLIRLKVSLPFSPKVVKTVHALIVIIGLVVTIPIYHMANYPKFFTETTSGKTCHICSTKPATGGYVLMKKNAEPVYLCTEHFEHAKQADGVDPSKDEHGNSDVTAFSTAKDLVSKRLKAPSTAKFCSQSDAEIMRVGSTWIINGWVDAQNSFGVPLRNTFTVRITFTAKYTYQVDQISIR